LRDIRESEISQKITKTRTDDCMNLFTLESDLQFSIDLFPSKNLELPHGDEKLKKNDAKFNENLKETPKKIAVLKMQDIVLEKDSQNHDDKRSAGKHCGSHKKVNFKIKTSIEKKDERKKKSSFLFLLSTIFVVREFVRKLTNLSFLRSPSKLKKKQFNLIGDKAYIKEENSNFIFEYMSLKFDERFFILDPS
jgi:hypothetical protein